MSSGSIRSDVIVFIAIKIEFQYHTIRHIYHEIPIPVSADEVTQTGMSRRIGFRQPPARLWKWPLG
jgi:hypothetical protein